MFSITLLDFLQPDHFGITIKIVFYHEGGWRFFVTGGTLDVRVVFMLLHDKHYYGVKNIKGFMGARYFCEMCHTCYHHKFKHDCQYFCMGCTGSECRDEAGGRSDTPQNMGLIQIVKGCVVKILHHCILGCLKNEDQMDFMDENNLIKRLCSQMSIPQIVWVIINISDKMDKLYFTRDTLQEVTNCIQSIEKSKDPNEDVSDTQCIEACRECEEDELFADLTLPTDSQWAAYNRGCGEMPLQGYQESELEEIEQPLPATHDSEELELQETVTSSLQKYRGLQIREAFSKVLKPMRGPHAVNGTYKERTQQNHGHQQPVCKKPKRGDEEPTTTDTWNGYVSNELDMSETQIADESVPSEDFDGLNTPEEPSRLLNRISGEISPNDFVQLRLDAEELGRPLFSVRRPMDELNADQFLSYRNSLELTVTVVKNHEGGGLRKLGTVLFSKVLEKKRQHLIDFNVEGLFLCFACSLLSLLDNGLSTKEEIITRAMSLHNTLGLSTARRVDFSQIHLFEDHFGITIKIVFYHEGGWRFFVTGGTLDVRVVFMLLHDKHYYGVKNIKGFMGARRGGDILEERERRCIDPFQFVTLASICMAQYRFMFLKKDTIALAPLDNYQKSKKSFSACSIQWLLYIEHTEGIHIQHALQGGEKKVVINGVLTAFEFYGCFFHGCPICYKPQDFSSLLDSTYGMLRLH
ncbi:hypothetical protein E2320_022692 [Naja naja]|nr:hypothetical protein E2320_022692 [Naja naja]